MVDYLDPNLFITMDPAIKAQWLADLRSGKIPQTKEVLHRLDTGGMCCLGVLSKIAADNDIVPTYDSINTFGGATDGVHCVQYGNSDFQLDPAVNKWANIVFPDGAGTALAILPFETLFKRRVYLADLNDGGFTFDQIADVIECFY